MKDYQTPFLNQNYRPSWISMLRMQKTFDLSFLDDSFWPELPEKEKSSQLNRPWST